MVFCLSHLVYSTVAFATLIGPAWAADTRWICAADKSVGFTLEAGNWKPTQFNVAEKKYVLSKPEGASFYSFNAMGQPATGLCDPGPNDDGFFHCADLFDSTVFSSKTLRYTRYRYVGYVAGDDVARVDPMIEIGTCAPF